MRSGHKRYPMRAASLLLGLGLAGAAIAAGQSDPMSGPVRCEIEAASAGNMIALEALVHADAEVSGSYRFRVADAAGAGTTSIRQGGDFVAGPAGAATLGKVMLARAGAPYDAHLEITAGGTTDECARRVGGAI